MAVTGKAAGFWHVGSVLFPDSDASNTCIMFSL